MKKTDKHHSLINGLLVAALFLTLLLSVGIGRAEVADASNDAPGTQSVWPPPPQTARIRYLKTIADLEDIEQGKGFFRRLWEFIRGPEAVDMRKPMALVVDKNERLFVADPAAKVLHVFDQKRGRYHALQGDDRERFELPIALALDADNTLYLADGGRRRVLAMNGDGDLLRSYGDKGKLLRPTAVAVDDKRQRLYVVDTPSHDIKVFDLRSTKLLKVIGQRGTEAGQFNYPSHISVDGGGRLYVTDALNGRIQVLGPEGEFLYSVGQQGDGSGDFDIPKGNAVDSEGHLYVADAAFDVIQIFNRKGELLLYFGSSGQGRAQFWMPTGLFIDHLDRIYVADSYNKRVQVFQYLKGGDDDAH